MLSSYQPLAELWKLLLIYFSLHQVLLCIRVNVLFHSQPWKLHAQLWPTSFGNGQLHSEVVQCHVEVLEDFESPVDKVFLFHYVE